ncbi:MAG: hypothetical protein E6R03_13465 [Hyphomicrobiaceae bacterium]|nr:MAG: hypothetical protein E6R03_13465 [Hyphomicrobiaceae bacterium]
MSNETTPAIATPVVSNLQPGDMLVEVIGNEVRFWNAITVDGKMRVRLTARSYTMFRERVLQDNSSAKFVPASDLTPRKLYNAKDRQKGMSLLRQYFPDVAVAHFFYSGRGPSGHHWGFFPNSHYTLTSAPVEVRQE